MGKPKTIALVGLGSAARRIHLPAYAKLGDLKIVAGVETAPGMTRWPFPVFTSLDEMLATAKPDIVAVITPPRSHFGITLTALNAGCHVLCEKPFMMSLEEADEVIETATRAGRLVAVNNEFRFMRSHLAAKAQIGRPGFGKLQFISINQTFHVTEATETGWRGEDTRRTAQDFGPHTFDLCRYFFDEDPLSIRARMPRGARPNGPDYLNLIELEFSGDRVAHITLDRLSRGPHRYLEMRLDGEAGCIETSLGGKLEVTAGVRGGTRRPFFGLDVAMGGRARLYHGESFSLLATDPLDVFADATSRLMAAFLGAIDSGTTPPCDAVDNRHVLALMLAAYQSDAERRPIAVSPSR
ncbi:MAG: Gfo/Idh/MocA family oxidoreductase [Pseudomonadota bacterium]|nr:Gfo/Idh/MocA family oxidoreductase [Pseudomonadota bacterium]